MLKISKWENSTSWPPFSSSSFVFGENRRCCYSLGVFRCLNPFPNKPWFLRVCSTSLLKTLQEKEKLLVTSNFSFSHSVFKRFVLQTLKNQALFGKGLRKDLFVSIVGKAENAVIAFQKTISTCRATLNHYHTIPTNNDPEKRGF